MLSRSAMVKLKAIFVIDLIIVGAAAGVYFYLNSEGLVAVAAKPAKFTLTNLIIDPQQAYVSNPIQISVNVTNIGDLEGNQTINFEINNIIKDTENITLSGNSSEIIQFADVESLEGNYTIKVSDLTGNFTIKTPPPEVSKIILSNLLVNPFEVWVNQTVTLNATAQNPTTTADKITVKRKECLCPSANRIIMIVNGRNIWG